MIRRLRSFVVLAAVAMFVSNLSPETRQNLLKKGSAMLSDYTHRISDFLGYPI